MPRIFLELGKSSVFIFMGAPPPPKKKEITAVPSLAKRVFLRFFSVREHQPCEYRVVCTLVVVRVQQTSRKSPLQALTGSNGC